MRNYSFVNDVYADASLFVSKPIITKDKFKDEILKTCCDTKHESVVNTPNPYAYSNSSYGLVSPVLDSVDPINSLWEEIRKLQRSSPAFVELSCKNCGAKIQQKYKDPIFKCPYCKTIYAVGYKQVNAT